MMRRRRWLIRILAFLLLTGVLLYLRDPPWLSTVDSGLFSWERNKAGQRFRWMGPSASFFVPADAASVAIPLHALFITEDRSPFVIRVYLNGRAATEVMLPDEHWRTARLVLPPKRGWRRRVARIDLRANRVWSDRAISVQVGELHFEY